LEVSEPDGSVWAVARALACRVLKNGTAVKAEDGEAPEDVLYEVFCWCWGVDGTREWVEEVTALRGPQAHLSAERSPPRGTEEILDNHRVVLQLASDVVRIPKENVELFIGDPT
jgi:hypothetical protein